ncbi:unnamed protein product [Ascophyllum nodosum]
MVEPGEDVFVPDGRVDTINTNNNSNIANKQNARVDVDELLDFIFPKSMQHPLSTGRLYAFAAYGPLGENANIRAGRGGMRIVSPWEMDTMCLQFEREDILQVYVSGGRPLFILNEAQKEEVIAQAESYLKTAKGRGYRRQVTRAEVIQILSGLSRDEARTVSFHDAQRAITEYRKRQIARFRVMFPDLVTWGEEKSSLCSVKASNTYAPPSSSSELISRGSGVTRHDRQFTPVATVTKTAGECATVRGAEVQSGRKNGRSGRRAKLSADVAPAEMFLRDVGYTPAGMAKHTNKLLSTRAFKVCHIDDANCPGLTENVRLIRNDKSLGHHPRRNPWDSYACLRGYNVGAHVRSARSTTTSKRKA